MFFCLFFLFAALNLYCIIKYNRYELKSLEATHVNPINRLMIEYLSLIATEANAVSVRWRIILSHESIMEK